MPVCLLHMSPSDSHTRLWTSSGNTGNLFLRWWADEVKSPQAGGGRKNTTLLSQWSVTSEALADVMPLACMRKWENNDKLLEYESFFWSERKNRTRSEQYELYLNFCHLTDLICCLKGGYTFDCNFIKSYLVKSTGELLMLFTIRC